MTTQGLAGLDRPVYGISEAARHLGLGRGRVRSWLDGYTRRGKNYPPVIRPEATGDDIVTWGEFVELGYLREYRHKGVSLQYLRPVIHELRDEIGFRYPLATQDLYLSGREIVWKLQKRNGLPSALAMVVLSGQMMILADGANSFFNKVQFDPIRPPGQVIRVYPAGVDAHVSIDPLICFGRPAVGGAATERLWELRAAGERVEDLAAAYAMDAHLARAGIAFEELHRVLAA